MILRNLTDDNIAALLLYCKKNKWLKADYAWALHAMSVHDAVGLYPDSFRKSEVIARFGEVARESYWKIASFLTLKEFSATLPGFERAGSTND